MHYFFNTSRIRVLATGALLVMATMLAACAASQEAAQPIAGGAAGTTGLTGGGQLELTVFDQYGTPLDQAEITVLSISGANYRVRGRANRAGSASFSRVPSQVRVQVNYQARRKVQEGPIEVERIFRGNGMEEVEVPEGSMTPVRLTIEVTSQ